MPWLDVIFSLPTRAEPWLLLGYVAAVVVGARLLEALARRHGERASNLEHAGFRYEERTDHFHCDGGARLSLHVLDHGRRMATYRAPVSDCARCPHKSACTPDHDARELYRSLASWAESDLGLFHAYVSVVMFGAAGVLAIVALGMWGGQPGTGLFMFVAILSMTMLVTGLFRARTRHSGSSVPHSLNGRLHQN
ncbi:MAG: hypothetical protein IT436_14140 [Phycisphaerales bacterium]|nr:hypothetical protein [Phycisphaerales bacterium]